ncbi:DUF5996 family protein [Microlunatus flavus]|uniref:Ava_C0101 and related proteins n=1 Tax=Microlunatus flavus TaxID=1036181 RepID=A0A1H9FXM3_9ACTN|nr:DUF5996 family protein [Microlunatus flavus]SEQ42656.1 hypothetical protein SAMN05421756_103425 [Microlunatus flavus]
MSEPQPEEHAQAQGQPGWPALPVVDWQDTRDTLHLWTQVVGKTALALAPPLNHWWGVTLRLTASGLATPLLPLDGRGLEVAIDLVDHELRLATTDGRRRTMRLEPRSVADFYAEYRTHLADLDVDVRLDPVPVEIAEVTPFAQDTGHASYDAAAVRSFFTSLVSAASVLGTFRAEFRGKASPVHFFWGAFDLAVTRFSGRPAPEHPGGVPNCPDRVMREAYDAELASCGYWPGGRDEGAFYAYAYPEPAGYADTVLATPDAAYDGGLGEFVLPYASVRAAADPAATLLGFLRETHAAAAGLAGWPPTA